MENINYYDLLRKFSRNILYTIFDFLPTDTVFLSLSLINKHFNLKVKNYQKIARTVELKYMSYPLSPIFPCIENFVFHMANTYKKVILKLPDTLINLKFIGNLSPNITLEGIPSHLQSFKYSSFETQDNDLNNIYITSLKTRTLKVLKIYKRGDFEVLTYLETYRLTQFEEIYLPIECKLDEATISLLLPNERLKKVSFRNVSMTGPSCAIDGLHLLSQIKSLINLTLPGFCLDTKSGVDKVIRSLSNLQVLKFGMYNTKCSVQNHINLLNSLSAISLKKICTNVYFYSISQDFLSFFSVFLNAFPSLVVLKMCIQGISITGYICEVIRICREHPSLYKFNGFPLKLLENSKVTSITLYEDLLKGCNSNHGNFTIENFNSYSNSLINLRELRIKPIRSAAVCIYVNKITEKIKRLGFFTDMNQYFRIPKWAFIFVLMIISGRPELKSLKLETIPSDKIFFNVLEKCTYLEEYEGNYSADLLQKVNFKSLKLDMRGKVFDNLSIFDILKNQYIEKFSLKQAIFIYPNDIIHFSLPENLKELKLIRIKVRPEFSNSLLEAFKSNFLTTVYLDFDFFSFAEMNIFIPALQYLTNIEILNLNFINLEFLSKKTNEHIGFINLLENNMRPNQKLKEFSLYLIPIPVNEISLYYDFLIQLCSSHLLLVKLYGISSQNFDIKTLSLILV
ncbi:hypothetical protein SteCoe_4804 [Stentor coeruleus]|uniref:F-box domain-containing protein n=1 Tax=Stentor coeruleus TaxID=5963 RepID=A0A1R2CU19_9CILI|nr:hypothetical protein SteCoe_4804 [Stentor coeruleus]